MTANAADDRAATSTDGVSAECADGRGGGPRGHGEELTGDTAAAVEEAVLADYPDATIRWLETDADGVYEAHILTAEDERLTVELDESFVITGTELTTAPGGSWPPGPGQRLHGRQHERRRRERRRRERRGHAHGVSGHHPRPLPRAPLVGGARPPSGAWLVSGSAAERPVDGMPVRSMR